MEGKLDSLLVEVLRVPADKLSDELTLETVDGWDSLRHMELVAALEEGLGLELTMEDIASMASVGAIREIVSGKS